MKGDEDCLYFILTVWGWLGFHQEGIPSSQKYIFIYTGTRHLKPGVYYKVLVIKGKIYGSCLQEMYLDKLH